MLVRPSFFEQLRTVTQLIVTCTLYSKNAMIRHFTTEQPGI